MMNIIDKVKYITKEMQVNASKVPAPKLFTYADMIWCGAKYGASPSNYTLFRFDKLSNRQRSTYVTNRLSRRMIRTFNDPSYITVFEDKTLFAKHFHKYLNRELLETENMSFEQFSEFVRGKDKIIYKPAANAQGVGIRVYDDLNDSNLCGIYKEIKELNEKAILEQWIPQHHILNQVYSKAVNCIRIITVCQHGQVTCLTGGVTWGNGKKIANASASGIVSPINFKTGILEKPAADFSGNIYEKHPITDAQLVGIKLPYFNETLEMIQKAAMEVPQVGYIGWDIAITPDGPVIIEGNTTPGYKYYQIPAHVEKDGTGGNRELYERCLRDKNKEHI